MFRWLVVSLALCSTGCATVAGGLLGAALCGDSDACRGDFIEAGAAADVAIAGAVAQSAIEDARRRDRSDPEDPWPTARTTGGEYTTPAASDYFHCVDADGRHVLETIAPSALEARMECAQQLGVAWDDPAVGSVCVCRTP